MKKIILMLLITFSTLIGQEKYSRDKFGSGWNTFKGCITVREHVLIITSKDMVTMDSKNCNIEKGKWFSIWENQYYYDPDVLDIDHTVPLKWAYNHGADKWTPKERNDYANNYVDQYHLVPLSAHSNRAKSDKGPDLWLPPYNRCLYVKTFVSIANKYKLNFSEKEKINIDLIQKKECK